MKTNTLVMESLEQAVAALAGPLVTQALLPGVEVKVYWNGTRTAVYASVLLDPSVYPDRDRLPQRGNRPLEESSSGRHWYDFIVNVTPSSTDTGGARGVARDDLNERVAYLLNEIAALNLRGHMYSLVAGL